MPERPPGAPPVERRVLLVAPQFPPSPLAGAHRARHLAKHLGAHGWRPTVVTVRPQDHAGALDPRLATLVPRDVEVLRAPAVPAALARAVGVGDLGLRGYLGLRAAALRGPARGRADLAFITGFPFYPMLIARALRRRGVPTILDFQDPWVSDWGAGRPALSKAGLAHRLARLLEPPAVAAAAGITGITAEQLRALRARHPGLAEERCCALPIGGDRDDHAAAGEAAGEAVGPGGGEGASLLYAGALLPRAGPALAALLAALAAARAREPGLFAAARLRFVGTAAVTDRGTAPVVIPLAHAHGVADLVEEVPWRLPYLEALAEMGRARVNLLLGSDEPHYAASKVYPALMSGRPFLSLFHARSESHALLARCGGGLALAFADGAALDALGPALAAALRRALADPDGLGRVDPAAVEPFTARAVAGRCAAFFERVLELEGPAPGRLPGARGGAAPGGRDGRGGRDG